MLQGCFLTLLHCPNIYIVVKIFPVILFISIFQSSPKMYFITSSFHLINCRVYKDATTMNKHTQSWCDIIGRNIYLVSAPKALGIIKVIKVFLYSNEMTGG